MVTATEQIRAIVLEYFGGDAYKAGLWFSAKNPMWGGVSPNDMIWAEHEEQVLKDVKRMVAENNGD